MNKNIQIFAVTAVIILIGFIILLVVRELMVQKGMENEVVQEDLPAEVEITEELPTDLEISNDWDRFFAEVQSVSGATANDVHENTLAIIVNYDIEEALQERLEKIEKMSVAEAHVSAMTLRDAQTALIGAQNYSAETSVQETRIWAMRLGELLRDALQDADDFLKN